MDATVVVAHPPDAVEALAVRRAAHRFSRLRYLTLVGGPLILGLGLLGASVKSADPSVAMLIGAGALATLFGALWRPPAWLGGRDPRFRGEQVRTVDREGLHVRGEGLAFDLPWAGMRNIEETPEFFLFFDQRRRAHHLTKARMAPADVDATKAMIRRKQSILESNDD